MVDWWRVDEETAKGESRIGGADEVGGEGGRRKEKMPGGKKEEKDEKPV